MIDEGFIRRTYRTSIVVWGIATLALLAFGLWFGALGFTIGAAVSLAVLAGLERIVRRVFVPGATGIRMVLAKFGVLKLLLIIGIVAVVVLTGRFDLILGFCAGVALTQVVMFLKVIGITLQERIGQ